MKHFKIIALFLLAVLVSLSWAGDKNVVELNMANSNKLVVKLMFRNGAVSDPAGKEGLTVATASILSQGGAGDMSYSEIQDKLHPWAAGYGANVDKEVTVFTFQVPADFADEFYPILRDVILKPAFAENDFKRIMVNQQNYVDQGIRAQSDEEYSKKALEDLLFRGTNYQHMKQGKSESVKSITLDDVKDHYKKYFTKNNLTIGIAGKYSADFLSQLKKDMATLPDINPIIPINGKARTPKGIEVEIISKQGAFGSAIFTGAPLAITRSDDDFAAMMVANSWMGEHRKSYSRLYQKIRETRSMNYGDYSYIEWYDNGGGNMLPPSGVPRHSNYFSIWIRPVQIAKQLKGQYEELADIKVGHAHFALRMAIREFDLLIANGMDEKSFEETRTFLRSYIKLYAQTPAQQLGWLMDSRFYGRTNYLKEVDGLLSKLTLADVNKAIKKYWPTENMFVTIVTDESEAGPLAKSLLENEASPMSYSNLVKSGLPEEVLAEDDEVANYKLNVKSVNIINSADTFK
ncbi:MAG: insulinase family protein [Calditrichaeota bacterium]|nr:MAG: insulinase family protein [Calditrichota bacterium]MBL1207896.1 insulinase family protein [Calditrichota bacterium]NOG47731.1 insulinase family protein [Calditrichota bacterium]